MAIKVTVSEEVNCLLNTYFPVKTGTVFEIRFITGQEKRVEFVQCCQNSSQVFRFFTKKVNFQLKLYLYLHFLSSPIACVACERTELLKTEIHEQFFFPFFFSL